MIAGGKGCFRQLLFSGLGQALTLIGVTSEWLLSVHNLCCRRGS